MSSDEFAICARDISKHYVMFAQPEDRLKQMIVPRLQRALGQAPSRYFRDFAALNGVSFDIRRGETVGIIGRNGSGKSTLLQIVCGTLQPTSGSVEVNGRIAALLELGAGFNPEFTGRENVYLNAAILGLSRTEIDARFDSIARFADIGDFIEHPVKTYSSGMYVRLAFATAINVDPDILVVDEALSVGDEAFQRKCFARIEEIKERGGTILFVSHGAQTIVQLCDRAMLIDGGEKILEGAPKAIVNQYQRLVNSSAAAAADIRAQIMAMRGTPLEMIPSASNDQTEIATSVESGSLTKEISTSPVQINADSIVDYFDPTLISQSKVDMGLEIAAIREVKITTIGGKTVNCLSTGKRYCLEYTADFSSKASSVGFGFGLRNVQGFHFAGLACSANPLATIEAGQCIKARFEFPCNILPGTYFVTCHIMGSNGEGRKTLRRVVDAICFKVQPQEEFREVGLLALSIIATVETAD